MSSLRNQAIIFAAKGNDLDFRLLSGHSADAIAMQPGAIDCVFHGECLARCLNYQFTIAMYDSLHLGSSLDISALEGDDLRVFPADSGVVRDSRTWHQQSQHAAAVRLNLAQLFGL